MGNPSSTSRRHEAGGGGRSMSRFPQANASARYASRLVPRTIRGLISSSICGAIDDHFGLELVYRQQRDTFHFKLPQPPVAGILGLERGILRPASLVGQ